MSGFVVIRWTDDAAGRIGRRVEVVLPHGHWADYQRLPTKPARWTYSIRPDPQAADGGVWTIHAEQGGRDDMLCPIHRNVDNRLRAIDDGEDLLNVLRERWKRWSQSAEANRMKKFHG